MNELPEKSDPLEQLLDRTLRPLPLRRAPPALQSRVLEDLQRRAALPWWHRSFAHWPSAARAGFVLVCLALIGVVFLGGNWTAATVQSMHASGALSPSWGRRALAVMTAAAELANLFARTVPPAWIYAGLGAGAVLYAALFGLGAAAYRTLYLSPAKGR